MAESAPGGLIGYWPSRSVTFLDNHDTEYCREESYRHQNDPTRHFTGKMADLGYAYLLTHPGVPCVFWPHYFDWGEAARRRIDRLIKVRQHAGVHAGSHVDIKEATNGLYAAIIDGRVARQAGIARLAPGGRLAARPRWRQVRRLDAARLNRNPYSEIRNPKSEIRNRSVFCSDFGFRISDFALRISDFQPDLASVP